MSVQSAALILVFASIAANSVFAEASGPDYYRVTGVAANDVLNLRAEPDAAAEKIAEIPHDARGLRNLGCEGGLSFAQWQEASEAEREAAAHNRWCRVEYAGAEGWVAGRFLAEDSGPAQAEEPAPVSSWKLVAIDGEDIETDASIAFFADGTVAGSTGCNRFRGTAETRSNSIEFAENMAMTMMACPPPADEIETHFLAVLRSSPTASYDPLKDELWLEGDDRELRFRRS